MIRNTLTPALDIAYEESGPADGDPVMLLHGFPYDVRAYDEVAPPLAAAGCRVIVPYLRGYGPTRFRYPATPRSGQQAALGADLLAFMDALGIERADPRRLRLGRPGGLHRRRTLARARQRSGHH